MIFHVDIGNDGQPGAATFLLPNTNELIICDYFGRSVNICREQI